MQNSIEWPGDNYYARKLCTYGPMIMDIAQYHIASLLWFPGSGMDKMHHDSLQDADAWDSVLIKG